LRSFGDLVHLLGRPSRLKLTAGESLSAGHTPITTRVLFTPMTSHGSDVHPAGVPTSTAAPRPRQHRDSPNSAFSSNVGRCRIVQRWTWPFGVHIAHGRPLAAFGDVPPPHYHAVARQVLTEARVTPVARVMPGLGLRPWPSASGNSSSSSIVSASEPRSVPAENCCSRADGNHPAQGRHPAHPATARDHRRIGVCGPKGVDGVTLKHAIDSPAGDPAGIALRGVP
jgi:hypothetical protein